MSAKILIVEDNPTNLKLVSDVLEFEGYDILKAVDAEEAQVVLAATLPDLILMDIALPGMDGLTLTRKLKAEERTRGIRIVALTAFAMKGDDQKALDAGCDGYITKPIDTRTLPDQVAGFLARASGQSRRSRIKILVVEDHAVDLKLADLVLSTAGYDVSMAETAEQAIAAIQQDRPQLLFLDLDLPGMDGLTLVRKLKADPDTRDIHVVAVTCYSEQYPKAALLAAGCDAYLLKPIDTRELSGQLTAVAEGGDAVFEAYDGVDALALLNRQRIDAVISDILMPRLDGYRLCHEIRKHARLHDLPIILYTSTYTSPDDEKLVRDVGADKYLKKPVSLETLVAALHEVIAKPHAAPRPEALQEIEVLKEYSERLVSKLKEKNTELMAAEVKFRALVEQSIVGIYIIQDDQFVFVNPGMAGILGRSVEEMTSRTAFDFIVPEEHALVHENIRKRISGEVQNIHYYPRMLHQSGAVIQVEIHGSRMDYNGRPAVMGVLLDITEHKQAEQALRDYAKRLRSVSRRLIAVEETERRNISRELHDRVGQHLAALNINLNIICSQLSQESRDVVGARLQDTQTLLKEMGAHIRDVLADLHPPALDDYGLLAALRTYVESSNARFAVPITVHGEDLAPRLSPAAEMALFRVAQGAIANATTHAHAKRIQVLLAATTDRATLTIADDGTGFDMAHAALAHASWGLAIMSERTEAVGATLRIDTAPGRGTRVVVEIERGAA